MAYIHYGKKKTKKSKIVVPSRKWRIFSVICLTVLLLERILMLVYWEQTKQHTEALRSQIIRVINNL